MALTATLFLILLFTLLYFKKFETNITLMFTIVLFNAAIITLSQTIIYNTDNFTQGILWHKIQHIGLILLVFFWVLFVNLFNPEYKRKKIYFGILGFISVIKIALIVFTELVITNQPYLFKGFQKIGQEGVLYNPFIIFYFSIILFEYIIFIKNCIKLKLRSYLPVIIGIGILILCGFKDLLETFINTRIPMLFETGLFLMNFLFAYFLIMRFIKIHGELKDKKRLEHEIIIAMDIQKKILPNSNSLKSHNIEIAALTTPAYEVGGDFYDFFPLDDNKLAFIIADVSGKSIPAALYMSIVWCTLKIFASPHKSPSQTMKEANNFLYQSSHDGMFATTLFGIYHKKENKIKYVSAGHTYPLYYCSKKDKTEYLQHQNKPLGVLENTQFSEKDIFLKKDDLFFIYTDGITEAINKKNEEFGEKQLLDNIDNIKSSTAEKITDDLLQKINNHIKTDKLYDDITLMTIKRS